MSAPDHRDLLRAEGLTVGYGRRRASQWARDGMSVALGSGELVCLLGPNGAGKSTLLRTLAGMQPPLGGRIQLAGEDLTSLPPRQLARRIGVVLPDRVQVGMLSAYALVALGRHPHTGWSGRLAAIDHQKVRAAMDLVGIDHLAARDVLALSDGERQKVMIARALAQEPMLLILDEPTAYLDLPGRVEIMQLLRTLVHEAGGPDGRAVLLSTHDLDLALRTADRLWLLPAAGELVAGVPEDLALGGALRAAFPSERVELDLATGSFRPPVRSSQAVRLRGEGEAAYWTVRALERVGYRVVPADGDGGLLVEVIAGEGGCEWRLADGGTHSSIAGLLGGLRGCG